MKFYTYFSRRQRLAVIVLVLVIISMQLSWVSHNELGVDTFDIEPDTYLKFQKEKLKMLEQM